MRKSFRKIQIRIKSGYDCADEAYSILCENAMDEVEQYLYNVETGDLEFSDRTRKYIEKQTEKYPDSAVEHDIVETAIRRVLKLAREAFVYGNF